MAIKALRDRRMKPPVVGRLWKGGAKRTVYSKKYKKDVQIFGEDLKTHFRFTSNIKGAVEDFTGLFHNGVVDEVPFFFPFDEIENNFDDWCEAYTASRLMHRCDGEHVVLFYDKVSGGYKEPPAGTMLCSGGCDWVARMSLIVPAFLHRHPGIVSVHLKGKNEIVQLSSELRFHHHNRGSLKGINFILYRYPKMISSPEGRVEKWLVGIRPDTSLMTMLIEQPAQVAALPSSVPFSPSEVITVDEDGVVIEEEPALPETKPKKKVVPEQATTNNHEALARAGNWAGAMAGIPRYADAPFPRFMAATAKIVKGGINNQALTRGEGAKEMKGYMYKAINAYAKQRDSGVDEFMALKFVHDNKSHLGPFAELLKPIATENFDDIPSEGKRRQTAQQPTLLGDPQQRGSNMTGITEG